METGVKSKVELDFSQPARNSGVIYCLVAQMNAAKRFTTIEGSCHCGNLSFEFNTVFPPDTLTIRSCQCSFCRAHGAATARDPDGTVRIKARDPELMTLYRFGTKTTDFLLCANCGVYVGAVITHDGKQYATLNMSLSSLDVRRAEPIVYDDESRAVRVARRVQLFTPVVECPF